MQYSTPELVVLGSASVLVLGGDPGQSDRITSLVSDPPVGVALGLDD